MKPFVATLIPSVVLMLAGCLTGLLVGQVRPWAGAVAGLVLAFVVGAPWAVRRIGSMGLGAAVLAALGACACAIEGRHAKAAMAEVEVLASFSQWNLTHADAVSVPQVHAKGAWAAQFEAAHSTKFSTRRIHRVATPLIDPSGQVVAVNCRSITEPLLDQGSVFVALENFEGEVPEGCREAVSAAQHLVERAGGAVDEGAFERVVRVYADVAALRADHQLASVTWAAAGGPLLLAFFSTWRQRARATTERRS